MNRESYWVSRDRTRTKIKDMSDGHLYNCIRMINSNSGWRTEYLLILKAEEQLRKKIKNSPLMKALA